MAGGKPEGRGGVGDGEAGCEGVGGGAVVGGGEDVSRGMGGGERGVSRTWRCWRPFG